MSFIEQGFIDDLCSHPAIVDCNWSSTQLQSKWDNFKTAFLQISNKHAPFQVRRLKDRSSPWITQEIINLMYRRDYLKRKSIQLKDDRLYDDYRRVRNDVTSMIRNAKQAYYNGVIHDCKGNSSKLWKVLNHVTGGKTNHNVSNGPNAETFNDYFNTIGQTTVMHIDD